MTPEEEYRNKILDIFNQSPYGYLDQDSNEANEVYKTLKEYAQMKVEEDRKKCKIEYNG